MLKSILLGISFMFVAVFGAFIKWLDENRKNARTLADLWIDLATSAFIGLQVCFIYHWTKCDIALAFMVASMLGHYGVQGIKMIGKYILRRFNMEDLYEEP